MTKERTPGAKPAEDLVKTTKDGAVELSESELLQVTGGRKAGKGQQEFLEIKLNDILITSVG